MMMKGEIMAKRSSFGSIVRKRLSDITNSQTRPKLVNLDEKQLPISSTDDLINQLLKEKAIMMKLVEERDKIIALNDNQLRNLRMHLQKLQLQNWNLAQSNSHILAELNSGREKLKALQHELVCKDALLKAKNSEVVHKDALLKAKNSELEGKIDINNQNTASQEVEKNIEEKCLQKASNRIRRSTGRSQSVGPSSTSKQGLEKEKLENKRRCLRRQSARFKSHEQEPMVNLFEIEDVKFPIIEPLDNQMQVDGLTLSGSSVIKEETCEPRNEELAPRSSLGRPVRRAAEKVQSYKEVPLNVKMRRNERAESTHI